MRRLARAESATYATEGVHARLDMPGGDLTAYAVDPEVSTMSPEHRDPPSRARKQHSETETASSGKAVGALLRLIALPVGWFMSVVAAMIVFTHYFASDPPTTLIPGIGPTATFYGSIAVVVAVGLVVLVKPAMIVVWWGLMGVLVAVAGFFFVGWTTLLVAVEVATAMYVAASLFFLEGSNTNTNTNGSRQYRKGLVTGIVLERWFR